MVIVLWLVFGEVCILVVRCVLFGVLCVVCCLLIVQCCLSGVLCCLWLVRVVRCSLFKVLVCGCVFRWLVVRCLFRVACCVSLVDCGVCFVCCLMRMGVNCCVSVLLMCVFDGFVLWCVGC